MRSLVAVLAAVLVSACATTATSTPAPAAAPAPQAAAQQYPAWLEMKPGYAETCAKAAGGCVPMTQAELQELASDIIQRTMQACRRASSI